MICCHVLLSLARVTCWQVSGRVSALAAAMPQCCDCDAGAELDFGKSRWLDVDRGIVSAPPKVHAAVIEAIKQGSV